MHVERQRQKGAACGCVRVVYAHFLRGYVALDLCPFGGRKFACAGGVGGWGGGGGSVEW